MTTITMNVMSDWSEQLVTRFSATARKRRLELGLSVQDVVDRTTAMGHPLNRSSLSDLENGRRKDRLTLVDALALSEALRMPLGSLLYPEQPDGEVEAYPGIFGDSFTASQSLIGESFVHLPEESEDSHRLSDLQHGTATYGLSKQIHKLRDSIEASKDYLDAEISSGDIERVGKAIDLMAESKSLMDRTIQFIRMKGGVVNDG